MRAANVTIAAQRLPSPLGVHLHGRHFRKENSACVVGLELDSHYATSSRVSATTAAQPASELVFPKPERVADAAPASREAPGAGEAPSLEHVEDEGPVTATHLRLGAEGVRRLRARHSEILARISERIPDPARQDELKGQAERLNPDSWVTEEEVRLGLEQYESVLDALRTIVGQGRRRRRRSGGPRDGAVEPPAGVPSDADSPERGPVESAGGRDAEDEEPV